MVGGRILLTACLAAAATVCGDDSGHTGDYRTCSVERRSQPDGPLRKFECLRRDDDTGPFSCDCDGALGEAEGDVCEDALRVACDVDPERLADFCEYLPGSCFERDDGFDCYCVDGGAGPVEQPQGDCVSAVFGACAARCESGLGSCEPLSDELGYRCSCTRRDVTSLGSVACEHALREACVPACELNDAECFVALDHVGLQCHCGDGELVDLTYDELGHDDCDRALSHHCD